MKICSVPILHLGRSVQTRMIHLINNKYSHWSKSQVKVLSSTGGRLKVMSHMSDLYDYTNHLYLSLAILHSSTTPAFTRIPGPYFTLGPSRYGLGEILVT